MTVLAVAVTFRTGRREYVLPKAVLLQRQRGPSTDLRGYYLSTTYC